MRMNDITTKNRKKDKNSQQENLKDFLNEVNEIQDILKNKKGGF